ncbi:MAG: dihydrolipoyl dehydrogenase, partial [Oscillospiraceae bacterium]
GKNERMDYSIVPACIYTEPEIAFVGISEEKAKEKGPVRVGVFNVARNGKAMTMGEAQGLIKIVSDASTGEILGAQIFAPRATDMIAEIAAVMKCEGTIEELSDTIHPHPTVSEILMEAAHDAEGLCCNAVPKRI